jgi:hypothetical protein
MLHVSATGTLLRRCPFCFFICSIIEQAGVLFLARFIHFLPLVHTFFIYSLLTIAKKPREQGNATSDTLEERDRLPDNLPAAQQGGKEIRSLVLLEGRKARIGTTFKKPTEKSVFLCALR